MPRVANAKHRRSNGASTPHKNSPIKIPLNDDEGEKAARMEARQARHDRQMNQIKAAVKTPMPPRRYTYDRASSMSPATPRGSGHRGRESDADGRRAVTPMKRVPILANFEEWMKMATDNKINANNSWNFALIDYFHDMSLLKEGDGVNFQKASCTLDGCVKIYTSRVDSVATETGKLLSGLADSRDKRGRDTGADGEGADDDEDEEGEDGTTRKSRRKRTHEATLAPSFAALQLKKFELEFSVDPLFKKASADFDEGGAKGLLLNHLSIDGQGRIVFDSSDDATEESLKDAENARQGSEEPEHAESSQPEKQTSDDVFETDVEIDIAPLASQFFPDLERLEEQDVCPSLKNFDLGDPSGSLDIPFLKVPEEWRNDKGNEEGRSINDASGIMLDDDNAVGFDDDDATLAGFDLSGDAGFGDGGEAWAREAALEPMLKVHRIDRDGDGNQDGDEAADDEDAYAISLSHQPDKSDHENILSYFDNALQKNWAGPEHWKIRRIKEHAAATTTSTAPKQRKEKEPFEIDFAAPLDPTVAELIYTPASSNSTISLPKTQWRTKGRNLLPDDKHFKSRQLLRLFLKPKARMGSKKLMGPRQFNNRRQDRPAGNGEMDEAFWAKHKQEEDAAANEEAAPGAYDADFFADDDGLAFPNGLGIADEDDDNLPFADAREMLSPPGDGAPRASAGEAGGATGIAALLNMVGATPGSALKLGAGGFGSQLVTQGGRRARPDYVAYARVAKKVDVRRLKQEMWKGMGQRLIASTDFSSTQETEPQAQPEDAETDVPPTPTPQRSQLVEDGLEAQKDDKRLRFTQIMNSLKTVYPPEKLRDISTSFGFICLLHLANEQGLVLESNGLVQGAGTGAGLLEEIYVVKDVNAVLEEGVA
ncbi:condensin subunit BRN1 [Aspergillus clavatus NRRL 1]|uniref:Condensin complex subunit 2 n=1 Tax=Aspergillus clavatus (strain ATCC 1007 / CBS 513.65 / DSM 816 / NCTC 3887 / NRRL 1 / QM 1276 / 107) TaxID=344612 RepID=A1CD76_ASPCL|nr:condensin complex component cnd2 [Aspergillus clavatus NRRL 1]EAW11803.1 condensin complex component cnd2 [Aspergillus clavatus NRRL 1]